MLYLARYAPPNPTPAAPDAGVAPQYHREIYEVLQALPLELRSATEPSCLFNPAVATDFVFGLYNKAPFLNSEIFVAAVCEYRRFAYLGAPPHIRAVAEDKHLAKIVATHLGIETPAWKVYRVAVPDQRPPEFAGPYIVKPRFGSASEHIDGTSLASTWRECLPLRERCFERGLDVMVESFIDGANITVPSVAAPMPRPFTAVSAVSDVRGNIITYRQKRLLDGGLSRQVVPATERNLVRHAHDATLRLHNHLLPLDYCRADFRWIPQSGKLLFLEVNVCCNLGSHSSFALAAAASGYSHPALIRLILNASLLRQQVQWEHL